MNNTDQLAKLIARGKWHFILVRGVLGWGVLTAALYSMFMFFTVKDCNAGRVLVAFILFPVGGIFWGAFMWWFFRRRFDRLKRVKIV